MALKMIFHAPLWLALLKLAQCLPPLQNYRFQELPSFPPPQDINSLDLEEPQRRSMEPSSKNSIELTIKEVEDILQADPTLPRLTRGEILDILENITGQDIMRDPKSIMVVMPYTPSNDKNLEELYTKPPVTQIIGSETARPRRRKPLTSTPTYATPDLDNNVQSSTMEPSSTFGYRFEDQSTTHRSPSRRRRPPEPKPDYRLASSTTRESSTTMKVTTYNPNRKRRPLYPDMKKVEIVETSTYRPVKRRTTAKSSKHPNHKYPDELEVTTRRGIMSSDGLRILQSPKLGTEPQFESDLSFQENIKHEVFVEKQSSTTEKTLSSRYSTAGTTTVFPVLNGVISPQENIRDELSLENEYPSNKKPFRQQVVSTTTKRPFSLRFSSTSSTTTEIPIIESMNLPDSFKNVVKDLNLQAILEPQTEKPAIPPSEEEKKRLQELLVSLGAFPAPVIAISTTTTTTTTPQPDVGKIAESISPEMRDLLMSFGLIPDPKQKPMTVPDSKFYPEKAEVKPESYVGFKPLPDDVPGSDDMDALLASFGLGRGARKEKAVRSPVQPNQDEKYNFDMIPDHLKGVVTDLGLTGSERQEKKIRTPTAEKTLEKQHVFSPNSNQDYASPEELKKLETLLNMIQQLEKLNGTATDEDLKKIDIENLKDLVNSLNGSDGNSVVPLDEKNNIPDPLKFDPGLVKNEIKRQENSTTESSSSTAAPSSTTTQEIKALNEEASPSLVDLEASFGGQATVPTEEPPVETTTARRRTGAYYLIDWNTFLDIDDQKGKRVNLRFQPTIGDPKRFYSVTVP